MTANSATNGGGGIWDHKGSYEMKNCIIYSNDAPKAPNYYDAMWNSLEYCLTTPLPTNGIGNINADPRFVNAAAGDFRLLSDSPCIDTGTDLSDIITTDILGNARGVDGNGDGKGGWDIGAYEFNSFKPPRFAAQLEPSPGGFEFTVTGEPGKTVRIERSRNLLDWEHVATVPIPTSGQRLIDPKATTEPLLFYRAVVVP